MKEAEYIGEEKYWGSEIIERQPIPIDDITTWLNSAKEQGATHVYLGGTIDWGSVDQVTMQAYKIIEGESN